MSAGTVDRVVDESTIHLARALVAAAAREGRHEPEYVEQIAALRLPEDRQEPAA